MSEAILVLVWLGTASSQAPHRSALDAWAKMHHVRWQAPVSARDTPVLEEPAPSFALEIESLLDEARVAAGSAELERALARLAAAAQKLREHPELAQAAWLMAEEQTLEALVLERTGADPARSLELRRRAEHVEGLRAAAYGAPSAPLTLRDAAAEPAVTVRALGTSVRDELEWDGVVRQPPFSTTPGPHQARVLRAGRLIAAEWVEVRAADYEAHVMVPEAAACSADDLASVTIRAGRVERRGARCQSWAVARPASGGRLDIARCTAFGCEPLQVWPEEQRARFAAPAPHERGFWHYSPYVAVGLGVLATTALVLWRTGVFDKDQPARERVVFDGTAALRF